MPLMTRRSSTPVGTGLVLRLQRFDDRPLLIAQPEFASHASTPLFRDRIMEIKRINRVIEY